jgi:predicted nucleic acid-binding protein
MRYLLDTTVIVDHVRGYPGGSDLLARLFEETTDLCTCDVITCEALSRGDEAERRSVRALLDALDFVALDPEAARWAGDRRRELLAAGRTHPIGDALIAGLA